MSVEFGIACGIILTYRKIKLELVVKDVYQEIALRIAVVIKEHAIMSGLPLLPGELPPMPAELASRKTVEDALFSGMKAWARVWDASLLCLGSSGRMGGPNRI